ncbi:MAG TPA: hypothetical protein VMY06_13450 [Sedimentisphaerales bacterium]|nr:hypothetical protein [Sedimentisphaerales bacterium]
MNQTPEDEQPRKREGSRKETGGRGPGPTRGGAQAEPRMARRQGVAPRRGQGGRPTRKGGRPRGRPAAGRRITVTKPTNENRRPRPGRRPGRRPSGDRRGFFLAGRPRRPTAADREGDPRPPNDGGGAIANPPPRSARRSFPELQSLGYELGTRP